MANANLPKGLWPLRHLTGGVITANKYPLKTGQTIYEGDLLSVDATGSVLASIANDGVKIIGVAAAYASDAGSTGLVTAMVYDDPNIVFGIQSDATGTAIVAADLFSCANHAAGAGSATTKLSGHVWNQNSIAATAKDLKLIGLIDTPDNTWGAYAKLEVVLNNHFLGKGTAGI